MHKNIYSNNESFNHQSNRFNSFSNNVRPDICAISILMHQNLSLRLIILY